MKLTAALFFLLAALNGAAQQLYFPDGESWRTVAEGSELSFRVTTQDSLSARFSIEGVNGYGIQFDTLGNFYWKPSFDLVDRLELQKEINVIFQAEWKDGRKVRQPISFLVTHTNRAPEVEELPVFYVKQGAPNRYQIPAEYVSDPDGDPLVFKAVLTTLPEGASTSALGLISWTPSRNQFLALRNNPMFIEFTVQDPDKAESKGRVKVAQTQLDLPPDLLLVPGDTAFTIKEDERINIKLYVTDPNGDENVASVSFVCSDERITRNNLKENSPVQSEFTWTPGYYFVEEVEKEREVEIIFFALDKSSNRVQKKIRVKVLDAENLDEKDKFLYQKYRSSLVQAKALIDQLDENHEKLNKMYRQAKKGKKNRSIVNATLGAATGLSPLVAEEQSKVVSGVGGTAVLTMGTLEATEVIGKSKNDILEKLKINVEIRNQLQLEGDNFARKYALKSARRSKDFDPDRDKLLPIINNQKLVLLELDASRPSYPRLENKELKKTFPDFSEE